MTHRLYYVTTVNISDFSAQSLQIKAMSNAFNDVSNLGFKLYAFSSPGVNVDVNFETKLLYSTKTKLFRTFQLFFCVIFSSSTKYSVFTRDLYLALLFTLIRKDVVWEAHQETSHWAKKVLIFLNFFNSFKVLTISEALKFSNEIPVNGNKVFSYHDGVSLDDNDEEKSNIISFSNKNTAVYTGALHKGKDIESLEPLFQKYSDWDFLLIGGNVSDIANYQRIFSKYTNVKFMGRIPHNEIVSYQRAASVLLYPLTKSNKLWRYTSPLKLFEYMKSGKPIIGSNIGSVSEIIDKSNAFVYKGEDGIVDAFEEFLIASSSTISKKTDMNLNLLKTRFNWIKRAEFIVLEVFNIK